MTKTDPCAMIGALLICGAIGASISIWWSVAIPAKESALVKTDVALLPGNYTLAYLDLQGNVDLNWTWGSDVAIVVGVYNQDNVAIMRMVGANGTYAGTTFAKYRDGPFAVAISVPGQDPVLCEVALQFAFERYVSFGEMTRSAVWAFGVTMAGVAWLMLICYSPNKPKAS